jgi:hypothetical protein
MLFQLLFQFLLLQLLYLMLPAGPQDAPQCLFSPWAFSDELSGEVSDSRTNKHQLQVTSVSWNNTGHTLAASFGR